MAIRRPTSPLILPPVPQNTPHSSYPPTGYSTKPFNFSLPSIPTLSTSDLDVEMDDDSRPSSTMPSMLETLLPTANLVGPVEKPRYPNLTSKIANLQLHPALEASLHILNADLPSAHFLIRHMSGLPAVEGMLLHSILHRIEGDFRNARAWYSDVQDACQGWVPKQRDKQRLDENVVEDMGSVDGKRLVEFVYAGEHEDGEELTGKVERMRKEGVDDDKGLNEQTRREMKRIVDWCKGRFGEDRWVDATAAWARPGEEVRKIGNDMVAGDKGWRKF